MVDSNTKHLRRLPITYPSTPMCFVTATTRGRKPILANREVHEVLADEWANAVERHWFVGSYVVMPNHVHFFCRASAESVGLSTFVGKWKEWTSKRLKQNGLPCPLWQEEFFDHILRSDESYSRKWEYVRENPVRAGLVKSWDEWPYQGHIHFK